MRKSSKKSIKFFEPLEDRRLMSAVVDAHPVVPAFSSKPGAAYTIYLDLGGFNFTGDWNNQGTPGKTIAYDTDGDPTTFSTQEKQNIAKIWALVAAKYGGLSVNVTTVDPAVAAGKAATDADRQTYYDKTVGVLHTVIGGSGGWDGGSGLGVSQIDVARNSYPGISANDAPHTNWIYSGLVNGDTYYSGGGPAHENGHAFGLFHQSDYALVVSSGGNDGEYDAGEPASALTASYSPIMGGQDGQTRNLWRIGTNDDGTIQNDIARFLSNPNMTLTDGGIGHTAATATPLALTGTNVNPALATGYINSASQANPNPIGVDNYTKDYFKFNTTGAPISLTLNAGGDRVTPGIADPGITFDGKFNILNSSGTVVASSTRAADSLSYSYNGTLAAGNYTIEVLDFGGYQSTRETDSKYFTSGSYFLTGTIGNTAPSLAKISGTVFRDRSGDGTSTDDTALSGVKMTLFADTNGNGKFDSKDKKAAGDTTDSSGNYSFSNLNAGKYFVTQAVPSGYVRTSPLIDSTFTVNLTAGQQVTGKNFTDFKKPSLSGISKISYKIGSSTYSTLKDHTKAGQAVSVTFTVTNPSGLQVSLVSYIAPKSKFSMETADQESVYQSVSAFYAPGKYTISVLTPSIGHYQVDFVVGYALTHLGPDGSNIFYTPQGRLLSADGR